MLVTSGIVNAKRTILATHALVDIMLVNFTIQDWLEMALERKYSSYNNPTLKAAINLSFRVVFICKLHTHGIGRMKI